MNVDPWTLAFVDPEIERAYWVDFSARWTPYVRLALIVLVCLFSAFAALDLYAYPDRAWTLLAVRFGFAVPLFLAAEAALVHPGLAARVGARLQELLLGVGIVGSIAMLAIGRTMTDGEATRDVALGALGFSLMLSMMYGFARLRLLYVVPLGLGSTALAGLILAGAHVDPLVGVGILGFGLAINACGIWATYRLESTERREFWRRRLLDEARERSDRLLAQALPPEVAVALRGFDPATRGEPLAQRHPDVTVILADIVGFTKLAEERSPAEVAVLLDDLFSTFDEIGHRHGIERIKTLGDAWLAAAGVPATRVDHAEAAARLAVDIRDAVDRIGRDAGVPISVRIGLGTGSAVSGVVGRTRFAFDLWGEAVALARQAEHDARPGSIHLSPPTAAGLRQFSVQALSAQENE